MGMILFLLQWFLISSFAIYCTSCFQPVVAEDTSNQLVIAGYYGRIFQTILSSGPHNGGCLLIRHYNDPTITDDSVIVPYEDYSHDGYNCSEDSFTELADRPSENPVPDVGLSNEIFESLSSADRFWVGNTYRTCGPWILPDPTAIFIAFHSSETLNGPLGFKLPPQQLYMIFTNTFYTCVYRQIPPTPNPSPTPVNTLALSHTSQASAQPTLALQSLDVTASLAPSLSNTDIDASVVPTSPTTTEIQSFSPSTPILPSETLSTTQSPVQSLKPTLQSTSPSVANQSRPLCFPAKATVELEDGSFKQMSSLQIGDHVLVSARGLHTKVYSPVYAFTHRDPRGLYEFVRICAAQTCILITSGHYIYVRFGCAEQDVHIVPAISVGDGHCMQLGNGKWVLVDHISTEMARGLYNPQTIHGDLMVNNMRVSTYTAIVGPKSAHAMLLPLRVFYMVQVLMKELFRIQAS